MLLLTILVSVIPPVLICWYFYQRDIYDREPPGLVIRCFFYGGLSVFPAAFIELSLDPLLRSIVPQTSFLFIFLNCFLIIAPVEEICKWVAMKKAVDKESEFNEIMDGIVYGTAAACGFAAFENIFYVLSSGIAVGFFRAFTAVPLHAFTGAISGFYFAQARFQNRTNHRATIIKGLQTAILFHALYDFLLFLHPMLFVAIFPLLWILMKRVAASVSLALYASPFRHPGYSFPIQTPSASHSSVKLICGTICIILSAFIAQIMQSLKNVPEFTDSFPHFLTALLIFLFAGIFLIKQGFTLKYSAEKVDNNHIV